MKKILLNKGLVAYVDDDDFEEQNQYHWRCERHGNTYYAVRDVVVNGKKTKVYMHRDILGVEDDRRVCHLNGNGLDNRKDNIRAPKLRKYLLKEDNDE